MIFFVIILIALGAGVYLYFQHAKGGKLLTFSGKSDPLEIARKRYAEGEISREEFAQIEQDLEERRDQP